MLDELAEKIIAGFLNDCNKFHKINKQSLKNIVKADLFEILQPTLSTLQFHHSDKSGPHSFSSVPENLIKIAEERLGRVIGAVEAAVDASLYYGNHTLWNHEGKVFDLNALSGDSHRGGFRPFLLTGPGLKPTVIKFADPRPYQFLAEILKRLSEALSVDLNPPACFAAPDNQWYCVDYVAENDHHRPCDPSLLMFGMGVLTSVAFCLGFVDLHLENIIVKDNKPIIIDPECIFYCFSDGESVSERLLNTGFLSHNVHLSALRGGISSAVPLYDFSMCVDEDGFLRYKKPVSSHRNKMKLADGSYADPCNYRNEILAGYHAGYRWFVENADQLSEFIIENVPDDFRVRFLARKTRHYASVIYMLNLPIEEDYNLWMEYVLKRFRNSGFFPESISENLINAEIGDIKRRDIPYFWMRAGENGIVTHQSGVVHHLNLKGTVRSRAINHLQMLRDLNFDEHIRTINNFLDIDILLVGA